MVLLVHEVFPVYPEVKEKKETQPNNLKVIQKERKGNPDTMVEKEILVHLEQKGQEVHQEISAA